MPVLRALPGLGGTGILPVIDRRDACPTRVFSSSVVIAPIMGGYPYMGNGFHLDPVHGQDSSRHATAENPVPDAPARFHLSFRSIQDFSDYLGNVLFQSMWVCNRLNISSVLIETRKVLTFTLFCLVFPDYFGLAV
jgi:hypothetical protein